MSKTKTTLLGAALMLSMILTIASCKKSDTTDNNTVADTYVGIWNAKDTTFNYTGGFYATQFNFSIAKKDANNVYLINFAGGDSAIFAVTPSSMVYSSGGSGSGAYFYSQLVLSHSGNKIFFTVPTGSADTRSGTATKQ